MTQDALRTVFTDPDQARVAIARQVGPYCKAQWANGVQRLVVTVEPEDDAKTVQQGRFYWGVVLTEIAEQALAGGHRFTVDAWHNLFKRMFLQRRKVREVIAGKKKPVVYTVIGSTKGLGVRKMGEYIERVLAYGAVDLGVQFSCKRWEDYRS